MRERERCAPFLMAYIIKTEGIPGRIAVFGIPSFISSIFGFKRTH